MKNFSKTQLLRIVLASLVLVGVLYLLGNQNNENSLISKVYAIDLTSLKSEISAKQTQLNSFSTSLTNLQITINSLSSSSNVTQAQLNEITKQINDLESQKNDVIKDLDELNNQILLIGSEIQTKVSEVKRKLTRIYTLSRNTNIISKFRLEMNPSTEFVSQIVTSDQSYIKQVESSLIDLQNLQDQKEDLKQNLITQLDNFNQQKTTLLSKVNSINSQLNSQLSLKVQTTAKIDSLKNEINQMTAQQKQLEAAEAAKLKQSSNIAVKVDTSTFQSGDFYFTGRGRDLYDGHGVGMSQWGAYGAGQAGFDYKKILKSYYTNIDIVQYSKNLQVNVSGYGLMGVEDYLAGIGEVPSTACSSNVISNCWPKETIKAQIVAARSYLIYYLERAGSGATVSAGPDFQVYIGGNAKKWAVDETNGEVATYGGKVIDAVFSSSHRGQSENNELVFTSTGVANLKESIIGTAYPYLRSVSDNSFAYKNSTYNFSWKTMSFSKDKLSKIFTDAGINIGNIQKIVTYKGGSNRVWSIGIFGDKATKYLASWMFKSIMNDYIYENYPTGSQAYLYSTEFDLVEVK